MKRKKPVKSVPAVGTTARGRRSALRINKVRRAFHPEKVARAASSGTKKDSVARASASNSNKSVKPKRGQQPARRLKKTTSSLGVNQRKKSAPVKSAPVQPVDTASAEPLDQDESASNKKVSRALKMLAIDFVESRVKPSTSSSSTTPSSQTKARKSSGVHNLSGSDKSKEKPETPSEKDPPARVISPPWRKTSRRSLSRSRLSLSSRHSSQTDVASSAEIPATNAPQIETRKSRLTIAQQKLQHPTKKAIKEEAKPSARRSTSRSKPGESAEDSIVPSRSRSRSKARLNKSECMDVDTTGVVSEESLSQSVKRQETLEAEAEPKSKLSDVISKPVKKGNGPRSALRAGIVRRTVLRGKTTARTVFRGRGSMTRGRKDKPQARPKVPVETSIHPEEQSDASPSVSRSRIIRKSRAKSEVGDASTDTKMELEGDSEEMTKTEDATVSRGRSKTRLISSESDSLVQKEDSERVYPTVSKGTNVATSKSVKLKEKRVGAFLRRSSLKKELSVSMESLLQDKLSALDQSKDRHSRSSSPGGTEARPKKKSLSSLSVDFARSSSLDNLLCASTSANEQKRSLMAFKHATSSASGDSVLSSSGASHMDIKTDGVSASFGTKDFYGTLKRKQIHDSGGQDDTLVEGKRRRLMARLKDISTEQIPNILYSSRVPRVFPQGQSPVASRESSPGSVHKAKDLKPKVEVEVDKSSLEETVKPLTVEHHSKDQPEGRPKKTPSKEAIDQSLTAEPSLESLTSTSEMSAGVTDPNSSVSETSLNCSVSNISSVSETSLNCSVSNISISTQTDYTVQKRPRGRPRIHPIKPKSNRARGRPKGSRNKKTIEAEKFKEKDPNPPVKRKRGRPSMKDLLLRKGMNYAASYLARNAQSAATNLTMKKSGRPGSFAITNLATNPDVGSSPPLPSQQSTYTADNLQFVTAKTVSLTTGVASQSTASKEPLSEEAMDGVLFSEGDSVTSSQQQSSSQGSPQKVSGAIKSRSLKTAVANQRKCCPTVRQMRANRRKLRTSRWASGRLPKQSPTAVGKAPRMNLKKNCSDLQAPKEDKQPENVNLSQDVETPVSVGEIDNTEVSIPSTNINNISTGCSEVTDTNQECTVPKKVDQPDSGLNESSVTENQLTDTIVIQTHGQPDVVSDFLAVDLSAEPNDSEKCSEVDKTVEPSTFVDAEVADKSVHSIVAETSVEDKADQAGTVGDSCSEHNTDQTDIADSSVADISDPPGAAMDSSTIDQSDQTNTEIDSTGVDKLNQLGTITKSVSARPDMPDQPSTVTDSVSDKASTVAEADFAEKSDLPSAVAGSSVLDQVNESKIISDSPVVEKSDHQNIAESPISNQASNPNTTELFGDNQSQESDQPDGISDCLSGHSNMSISSQADHPTTVSDLSVNQSDHPSVTSDSPITDQSITVSDVTITDQPQTTVTSHSHVPPTTVLPNTVQSKIIPNVSEDLSNEMKSEELSLIPTSVDQSKDASTSVEKIPQTEAPKAKWKQSRELKRLQRDEGVQRIMSWHEKKKLKSFGLLLRSKTKDAVEVHSRPLLTHPSQIRKRANKLYSVDAISDTRLLLKKADQAVEPREDLPVSYDAWGQQNQRNIAGADQETDSKVKQSGPFVYSSLDGEHGPPPLITEVTPFKDNRSERCRSEELSPPPLIRPEDPYSEDYFVSMPVLSNNARSKPAETVTCEQVSGETESLLGTQTDGRMTDGGIDALHGMEASGAKAASVTLGSKKKRGRPAKRKSVKMGPASKTGREPHVQPSLKLEKKPRIKTTVKIDPSCIQSTSHLSQPRTFALRPKTTRSPIEIIAMRQKQEEEEYELAEATRRARILKRRQAHMDKVGVPCDPISQVDLSECRPCSVILVDFVKELHLNSLDTSDQYVSDVSYDSDEKDLDDDDYSADYDPLMDEADMLEEEEEEVKLAGKSKLPSRDLVQRKVGGALYVVSRKQPAEVKPKETLQTTTANTEQCLEPTQAKKPALDLDSMRGQGFMGNFVDFIQNRENPVPKMAPVTRFFHKTSSTSNAPSVPVSFSQTSVTLASQVSVSSDTVACPPGPASVGSSSVSSANQVVTAAEAASASSSQPRVQDSEGHVSSGVGMESSGVPAVSEPNINRDSIVCPEDKTVSSSPYKTSQTTEDVQSALPSPPKVRPVAEKGVPSGKLKVFPMRRDSDCGAGDNKVSATRYLCTLCDFSATNKGTIESHVYRHIPGVNFKCGYCESEFTGLVSALTHVKNSHHKEPKVWISKDINEASLYTEEVIPACADSPASKQKAAITKQICESPAVQEAQPVIISLVMSGDLPVQRQERFSASPLTTQRRFACTHCSYSTNVMEDANQHVRDLHRGNSLYTCYLCDKAFGCSLQEVEAHCAETHPHRQNSYKKLPDFYDQELMRASSSSGDRGKGLEDRGNIFDRMSNFFPNLGPGSEVTEDGQLSPAARHLRARDYLYIRDGWSVKTSAEADSTTIEDIELPIEDSTEAEVTSLDSTTDEVATKNKEREGEVSTDSQVFSTHAQSALPTDEAEILTADKKDDTQNASSTEIKASDSHPEHTSVKDLDSCKELELSTEQAEPVETNSSSAKSESDHCEQSSDHVVQEPNTPATGVDASTSSLTAESQVSMHTTAEDVATSSENVPTATEVSEDPVSELSSSIPDGETTDSSVGRKGESHHEPAAEISSESTPSLTVMSEEMQPEAGDGDGDADDDAENDILVINLDDDVMADDDSTPEDEKADPSLADVSAEQADASTVSHDEEEADDSTGIKILSVVSLRDTMELPGDSLSPDKLAADFPAEPSPPASVPSSPPVTTKPVSTASPASTPSPRRSSVASRAAVPQVNADDIAMRNEKMVCTYKCFKCSVHSPQLSAIVEHLKQYHMDVPLFACPYCSKKVSFYTEEKVHLHVRERHPSNYAKNEVSLSEMAKSFIQVLAFPSGRDSRDSQIEHDIFMCLECESHIPDLDYGLRHLKSEHPDLLKYACPTCGMYSDSSEEGVKGHMQSMHGQASESVPLSVAMEGVFLSKVISISQDKQYRDHVSAISSKGPVQKALEVNRVATPPKSQTLSATPVSSDSAVNLTQVLNPASFQAVHMPVDNTTLVASSPISSILLPVQMNQVRPLLLAPVQQPVTPDSKSKDVGLKNSSSPYPVSGMLATSSALISPRAILPMPVKPPEMAKNLRKAPDVGTHFQKTGVTVKNMLDSRQKDNASAPPHAVTAGNDDAVSVSASSPSSPADLSVNTSTSSSSGPSSLSPRGMFSMTDKLDRLGRARRSVSPHSSSPAVTTNITPSKAPRPVLKVPQVASALNLTSSAQSQDTSASVETSVSATSLEVSPAAVRNTKSVPMPAMPFSIAALTAPAAPRASTSSSMDGGEDPEAFKIFNLKPRVPTPQGPRAAGSPAVTTTPVTLQFTPSPAILSVTSLAPSPAAAATVTMASSALFPQQFRVQQPPQHSVNTLPIGQGGLPIGQGLAMPIGTALAPFNQSGGITVPINVTQAQLLMAQQSLAPLVFSTNLLAQIRGSALPQLAVTGAGAVAAPAAHQQQLTSSQAVNLSLVQPSAPALALPSGNPRPILPIASPPAPFQPRSMVQNRGRGRPKLNRSSPLVQQQAPRLPTSTPASAPSPTPPPPRQPGASFQSPLRPGSPAPASGVSSRPAQQQRHITQQYVCPYCPEELRPWEVAHHIHVNHPGREVKYKRV